ncbi:MAG: zinc-ribbon domain-containing protein, partial [Candidatus Poseidoniaceae archaeon]|nr:zinc-ribbon domain-containing protein [Candidatus Poseidoniaceae archaeon]
TLAMTPGSTSKVDLSFEVPLGTELILTAQWTFDGTVIESEKSFSVSLKEIEDESFEIPWVALGGGIATSAAIILILHLRRSSNSEIDLTEKKKKASKKVVKKEVESVERSCPSCERTLRIPGDYSGTVRCPDCSERFEVEAEPEAEIEEEDDDDLEIIETPPAKVEISCPECSSTLRVPSDYGGSVRCPSCSTVFSAKQNG